MIDKKKEEKTKDVSKKYSDLYQAIDAEMKKKFGDVPLMILCFIDPNTTTVVGATNINEKGIMMKKILVEHVLDLYGGDLEHVDFSKNKPTDENS